MSGFRIIPMFEDDSDDEVIDLESKINELTTALYERDNLLMQLENENAALAQKYTNMRVALINLLSKVSDVFEAKDSAQSLVQLKNEFDLQWKEMKEQSEQPKT